MNHSNQKGYMIVEALIATALLIFGFVAGNQTQIALIHMKQATYQQSEAVQIAQQKMEQFRGYTNIEEYQHIKSGSDTVTRGTILFQRHWTVINKDIKLKEINLSVSWVDREQQKRSIVLISKITYNNPKLSGQLFNSINKKTALFRTIFNVPTKPLSTTQETKQIISKQITAQTITQEVSLPGTNNVLTYDQNGNLLRLNRRHAVTLSGTIKLSPNNMSAENIAALANITLVPVTLNSQVVNCTYEGSSSSFSCIMGLNWSGSIFISGINQVKVCVVHPQPYINLTASLNNQDYLLIKLAEDCPANYPFLLQTL